MIQKLNFKQDVKNNERRFNLVICLDYRNVYVLNDMVNRIGNVKMNNLIDRNLSQQIKAGDTHGTSGRKRKDCTEKSIITSEDSVYDGRNNLASADNIIFINNGKERQGMSSYAYTLSQYLKLKERRGKVSNTFLNLPCFSKDK